MVTENNDNHQFNHNFSKKQNTHFKSVSSKQSNYQQHGFGGEIQFRYVERHRQVGQQHQQRCKRRQRHQLRKRRQQFNRKIRAPLERIRRKPDQVQKHSKHFQ